MRTADVALTLQPFEEAPPHAAITWAARDKVSSSSATQAGVLDTSALAQRFQSVSAWIELSEDLQDRQAASFVQLQR